MGSLIVCLVYRLHSVVCMFDHSGLRLGWFCAYSFIAQLDAAGGEARVVGEAGVGLAKGEATHLHGGEHGECHGPE
jgi:hypothetical protein